MGQPSTIIKSNAYLNGTKERTSKASPRKKSLVIFGDSPYKGYTRRLGPFGRPDTLLVKAPKNTFLDYSGNHVFACGHRITATTISSTIAFRPNDIRKLRELFGRRPSSEVVALDNDSNRVGDLCLSPTHEQAKAWGERLDHRCEVLMTGSKKQKEIKCDALRKAFRIKNHEKTNWELFKESTIGGAGFQSGVRVIEIGGVFGLIYYCMKKFRGPVPTTPTTPINPPLITIPSAVSPMPPKESWWSRSVQSVKRNCARAVKGSARVAVRAASFLFTVKGAVVASAGIAVGAGIHYSGAGRKVGLTQTGEWIGSRLASWWHGLKY